MERALTFAGYEVYHTWGNDAHNGNHGTSIFPDAMRWLWKDWPKPVTTGSSKNQYLTDILLPGAGWELAGQNYRFTEGTAVNAQGEVYFQDIPNSKTFKAGLDGKIVALPADSKKASATCFGPDGKRYVVAGATKQIIRYDATGQENVVADSIPGNDLVVAKNGNVYVTSPQGTEKPGKIYLVTQSGKKLLVDEGLKYPNGIALTPDQTQLYVAESASQWVWIYTINTDGTLTNKQRFGWLHVPDGESNAWADGMKCDTAGRLYVASRLGIQVLDQLGRVNAVIEVPTGQASNCCFGGEGFNTLYVTCGDKVYRRRLNVSGANTFENYHKPKKPNL